MSSLQLIKTKLYPS